MVDDAPTAILERVREPETHRRGAHRPAGRSYGWALALPLAAVTLAVSAYRAGDRQLGEDEHATWHAATIAFPDFLRLVDHLDLVLAPYYLLMRGWIMLFGWTDLLPEVAPDQQAYQGREAIP